MAIQIHWTQLLAMFATEKPKLRAAQRKDPATMALVEKNLKKSRYGYRLNINGYYMVNDG